MPIPYEIESQDLSYEESSSMSGMLDDLGGKRDMPQMFTKASTRKRSACLPILQIFLLLLQLLLLGWHSLNVINPSIDSTPPRPILTTYGNDKYYMTLDHNYDFLWESKAIEKAGVISIAKDEQGKTIEYGAITMFHQLHCLASFRKALQKAREGLHVAVDWSEDPHWPHCLYYLRQTILCVADGQIEKQQIWNRTSLFIDGTGDFRQCNDHQPLFDLFDINH